MSDKNEIHNKGQSDGASGKYDPPNSVGDEFAAFVGVSHKSLDEVHAENAAYRTGQQNGKK